jgi:hypothetical protein
MRWWVFSEYIMYKEEIVIGGGVRVGIGDIVERE